MTDDPQWNYLLAAIGRIETRLEKLAESDSQKSALIMAIKEDLHRVEKDLEAKMVAHRMAVENRITPMEGIAEIVRAGKIMVIAIFSGLLALSGALGAWSVIKEWFFR